MTAVSGYGDCNGFGRIWVEDGQASNIANCPGCVTCRRVSAKLAEITRGGGQTTPSTPTPDSAEAELERVINMGPMNPDGVRVFVDYIRAQALRIKALEAVIERSIDEMEGVHSDLTASRWAWARAASNTLKRVMADLHDILLGSTEGRDDG